MHTYQANGGTRFNYNSDFSGSVHLAVPGGKTVYVLGEDLIDFIAYCFVLPQRVSKLEDASSERLLE